MTTRPQSTNSPIFIKKAPQRQLGGAKETGQLRLPPPVGKTKGKIDVCEQMFNRGETGPIREVSLSRERVTESRGLMIDVDPSILRESSLLGNVSHKPTQLYHETIRGLLQRHKVLASAEVRRSGRGLHCLFWFKEPQLCDSDDARERIESTFELISNVLPGDPQQPLLNAMTRALGSTNSKNNVTVTQLATGRKITFADLEQLATDITVAPFRFVLRVWGGDENRCPRCRDSDLTWVKEKVAHCYRCGKIALDDVIESAYQKNYTARSEVSRGE